jgi:hypothetical protein
MFSDQCKEEEPTDLAFLLRHSIIIGSLLVALTVFKV